jgi:transcriptional regulator with XRE-family HTH domain
MEDQMAKINVPTRPGALFELLKNKGMTQVDAFQKTKVDRKTLLKINRGGPVKLDKLQQVANELGVPEEHLLHAPAAEVTGDGDVPEPGTIMLRRLDGARLKELLNGAKTIRWHLKALVRDDASRKFLEEFEQAVENFRKQLDLNIPEAWDADPSLRFQLNLLKTADDIAARLEQFTEHRLSLLGGDYLFWDCASEDGENLYHNWMRVDYRSSRTVLLSVEPSGTSSRRAPIFHGSLPPTFSPKETRNTHTTVWVNGVKLPTLDDTARRFIEDDSDIPF